MQQTVLRLFPLPGGERELEGLYLSQGLRAQAAPGRPYVYTNFIASLDGRVSQPDPASGRRRVPPAIANPRDWRLYLELSAQADVLLTTSRHLRAVAAGRHGELLCIPPADYPELATWRRDHGLPAYAPCVAVSQSLRLPLEALRERHPGEVLIVTGGEAPAGAVRRLEAAGVEVVRAGPGPRVNGAGLVAALAARGYSTIYSIAGPQIMHALLAAGLLDRLYLTLAQVALGGEEYDTLVHGPALMPPRGFRLHELYLDPHSPPGAGQLFASLERA